MPVVKNLMVRAGADFSAITKQANKAKGSMKSMQRGVSKSCSAMKSALGTLGVALSAAAFVSFAKAAKAAYAEAAEADAKLAQVMRNTMGASNDEIAPIRALASAQQALGVVGDDVQLAGAQELATYLELSSSLETLIPVMNDMLAQQYGLAASGENAANIATMLGKVMNGQTGALSRYGYSFTKAQEEVLKFGTEEQRAAVLADVVRESVGGMNAALANTPSGRLQQLNNTLGDIKESFGQAVTSVLTAFLPALNTVASALAAVATLANRVAQSIANVFGQKIGAEAVSYQAATAGAAGSMGTLAKNTAAAGKAAKGLSTAGFDTLQKLSKSSGSGGGESADVSDSDTAGGVAVIGIGAQDAAEGIGWLETGLGKLKDAIETVQGALRDVFDLLTGKISLGDYIGQLSPLETVLWGIAGALGAIAVVKIGTDLLESLGKVGEVIGPLSIKGMTLHDAMKKVFGPASVLAGVAALVGGITVAVTNFIGMWENGFSWIKETLMVLGIAIGGLGLTILGVPGIVAAAIAGIAAAVATAVILLKDNWASVKADALAVLEQMKSGIFGVLDAIKQQATGWCQLLSGIFTLNFQKMGEGLKTIGKSTVNFWISCLNTLISGINAIAFPLRALIVGLGKVMGKSFTLEAIRIPSIPKLATGAVIEANNPFMAVLGDQTSGRNIETPEKLLRQIYREESGNREVVTLLAQILEATESGKTIKINERTFGRLVNNAQREHAWANG